MREVPYRHDILLYDRRDEILDGAYGIPGDVREWRSSFRPEGGQDILPGRIPTIEETSLIIQLAEDCHDLNRDEADWNVQPHYRILQSLL
ncbi:hypothetical protein BGZ63DRAFT_377515 [Mariannaea sp. PMI_226]|nr:hypothetical protein BGZ63DRAFT_377515 [Mariannaea sp. PMI_226]